MAKDKVIEMRASSIGVFLSLLIAIVSGTATFVRAQAAAEVAVERVERLENRYSNTQTEFRELQGDVAEVKSDVGIIQSDIEHIREKQSETGEAVQEIRRILINRGG